MVTARDKRMYVTAEIRARPGAFAQLSALAERLIDANRLEPGCLYYALHKSASAANTLLMYEVFVDAGAFNTHLETAHVREFRSASAALAEEPLRITCWECVGEPPAMGPG